MITWVIGAGGLLGSAIASRSGVLFRHQPIPWHDEAESVQVLNALIRDFSRTNEGSWRIVWAAGHATTASDQQVTDREARVFHHFVNQLAVAPLKGSGVFVFTSSAGGVYAGSREAPFNSRTQPRPLSPYGELKLAQERAASGALAGVCPVVIARVSNLYGPGQDLTKLQGFISQLALSIITKRPISIFVPLDTLRDYLFVEDAAQLMLAWADAELTSEPTTHTRVVASGESVSLASIIAIMQDVARTRAPIAYGVHDSALGQALDLRLDPDRSITTERIPRTPLPVGIKFVYQDLLQRHASARLMP